MSILLWLVVGVAVGVVAGLIAGGQRVVEDAIVAAVGSVIGGWLFVVVTGAPVTQPSPPGAAVALVTSVVFTVLARGLAGDRAAI